MSPMMLILAIVWVSAVIPFAVIGYLIRFKGKRNLIAGWDESKVRDPEGYGGVMGWSLLGISLLLALLSFLWLAGALSENLFAVAAVVVSFLFLPAWAYAKSKYA